MVKGWGEREKVEERMSRAKAKESERVREGEVKMGRRMVEFRVRRNRGWGWQPSPAAG